MWWILGCGSVVRGPVPTLATGAVKSDVDGDGFDSAFDCNDNNRAVYPGAPETCDGVDNNCNGRVDDNAGIVWYRDADNDGLGRDDRTRLACSRPRGFTSVGGDCDDANAGVGAPVFGDDCDAVYGNCDATASLVLVPGDHDSVQAAIDAAAEGDTVCVGPGTWTENLDLGGKGLSFVGALGADATILDGGGAGSVVTMDSGEPAGVVFEGFTLTNGHGVDGGAFYMYDTYTTSTLRDLVLQGNEADDDGGAVYAHNASPTFEGVDVRDNVAGDSGGGMRLVYAVSGLTDSVIADNRSGGSGGGLITRESVVTLDGVAVEDNIAGESGGGLESYKSAFTLVDVTLARNASGVAGGGYASFEQDNTTGFRLVATGNVAGSKGGALYIADPQSTSLQGVLLVDNAAGSFGGGITFEHNCTFHLTNATLVGNIADDGAGIAVLSRCTNTNHPGPMRLLSSIVAYNVGTGSGGLYASAGAQPLVSYSDVYGNGVNWSGLASQVGTRGNVSVNPSFVTFGTSLDADLWDLHLRDGTGVSDLGDPSATDPDGTRADMGAYGGPSVGPWVTGWYLDADRDGLDDGWEAEHGVTSATADDDGDGLDNADEYAAGTWPTLADTDGDGINDGPEVAAGTDPLG